MTTELEKAIAVFDMILEIGEPEDTIIPIWPQRSEMEEDYPLTVGMIKAARDALQKSEAAPVDLKALSGAREYMERCFKAQEAADGTVFMKAEDMRQFIRAALINEAGEGVCNGDDK